MKSRALLFASYLFSAILFGPVTANALTTYTYTGNAFDSNAIVDNTPPNGSYTSLMFVSGTFTVNDPLAVDLPLTGIVPLAYSFNDGRNTLTNLNSTISEFLVGTDSFGNIDEWGIRVAIGFPSIAVGQQIKSILTSTTLSSDMGEISEIFNVDSVGSFAAISDTAENVDAPGSWSRTITTAVPEPAALLLFTSGAGLLSLFLRRRKT